MNQANLRFFSVLALVGTFSAAAIAGCGSSSDGDGAGGSSGTGGSGFDAGADQSNPPPENAIRIHGSVLDTSAGMGAAMPVAGAEVRASVDRNGDGSLSADEVMEVSSGFDGAFDMNVEVEQGDLVVVRVRSDGSAPAFRTVVAGPKAEVELTFSLAKLAEMSCGTGRCSTPGNLLSIEGLPDGVQGAAQIFNPVTQPDRFPGGFQESTGKMLLSGVFASVELTDANGEDLEELAEPATLRMNVPVDTWNIMTDIETGTDRVEVPLYAFDEEIGTWVRDGEGYLEDAEGNVIPESDLESIRDGSYDKGVVVTGEVTHFSYWNLDWPVESHGCVGGRVVDADGNPAEGAVVSVRGVTYDGSSTPVTVGPDGTFCVDVMRSEGPGEDVDQDGVPGETQSVSARVFHGGKVYAGAEVDVLVEAATCGEGGCTEMGDIALTPDNELQISVCEVSGTVRDRAGDPVEGASVYAFDQTLETEAMMSVCGQMLENCTFVGTTGPDGAYSVATAMLEGLTVFASYQYEVDADREAVRQGQRYLTECPQGPVDITLDQGYDIIELWVDVMGDQIEWEPNLPATMLMVADETEEDPKWQIMGMPGGFSGPVTYGTTPSNAIEVFPSSGAPAPLESGDEISVVIQGTTAEGYGLTGQGQVTVP